MIKPFYQFFNLCILPKDLYLLRHHKCRLLFSSRSFMILGFKVRSMIHLKLILWIKSDRGQDSFFPKWISSCSSSFHWKNVPSPIDLTWHFCRKSISCVCVTLLVDSVLFHLSIYLSVSPYAHTTPSWVSQLHSKSWYQVVQVFQLCSFWRLFWLF